MKVLHVVTLVSDEGAYGGPSQVALLQAAGLSQRGHEALVVAGAHGYVAGDHDLAGAEVKLFRSLQVSSRLGFAARSSPMMLLWLVRNAKKFDLIHLHLARDLTLGPAGLLSRILGLPVVVQSHGMIDDRSDAVARIFDTLFIQRVVRNARLILCLTPSEQESMNAVAKSVNLPTEIFLNGLPSVTSDDPRGPDDHGDAPEVLFLARLQERKRPLWFVEMAARLLESGANARFAIVGPDGGQRGDILTRIQELGLTSKIVVEGPVPPSGVPGRMGGASIYVLPAMNEPFGLTIAEAMAAGVPVVISASGGLAHTVSVAEAGIAVDDVIDHYVRAVQSLLDDPKKRARHSANARALAQAEFSQDRVVSRLLNMYESVCKESDHRAG